MSRTDIWKCDGAGTAFVIGLLEIICGELETGAQSLFSWSFRLPLEPDCFTSDGKFPDVRDQSGVTRFIAVSVKTFVLCLGASFGLMLSLDNTRDMWLQQAEQCGLIDLDAVWWRVPLYLLCSASVLGQYRFPVRHYWRGLTVQLAAYETQYQLQKCALQHEGLWYLILLAIY